VLFADPIARWIAFSITPSVSSTLSMVAAADTVAGAAAPSNAPVVGIEEVAGAFVIGGYGDPPTFCVYVTRAVCTCCISVGTSLIAERCCALTVATTMAAIDAAAIAAAAIISISVKPAEVPRLSFIFMFRIPMLFGFI
jgi:hypothetical protein